MTKRICAKLFFQGLGENPCSLQPALKSNAPAFNPLGQAFYSVTSKVLYTGTVNKQERWCLWASNRKVAKSWFDSLMW